jgi:hypothetical protein
MPQAVTVPTSSRPERWALDAGSDAVATLTIPADAVRERRFEIACAMTVAVPDTAASPWHQMTVQANGSQLWRRRLSSQNPGEWDSLDYRCTRTVPVGQALRITVTVATQGARRRSLLIEADEQP